MPTPRHALHCAPDHAPPSTSSPRQAEAGCAGEPPNGGLPELGQLSLPLPCHEPAGHAAATLLLLQSTKIAVVTAGSLCPGLNDVIRALVLKASQQPSPAQTQSCLLRKFVPVATFPALNPSVPFRSRHRFLPILHHGWRKVLMLHCIDPSVHSSLQALDYGVKEGNILGIRRGYPGFYHKHLKPVQLTRAVRGRALPVVEPQLCGRMLLLGQRSLKPPKDVLSCMPGSGGRPQSSPALQQPAGTRPHSPREPPCETPCGGGPPPAVCGGHPHGGRHSAGHLRDGRVRRHGGGQDAGWGGALGGGHWARGLGYGSTTGHKGCDACPQLSEVGR